MAETTNLHLPIVGETTEEKKMLFSEWRKQINGEGDSSMAAKIDAAYGEMKEQLDNMTVAGKAADADGNFDIGASDVGAVPTERMVNGKPLTADVNLTAGDVGARPSTWTPTAEETGARPNTWTPSASDVGARSDDWLPTPEDIGAADDDHTHTAEQVGARPSTWMPTAEDVGARPDDWMPTAEQVGARADTWMPTAAEVGARPASWMPSATDVGALPSSRGTDIDENTEDIADHESRIADLEAGGSGEQTKLMFNSTSVPTSAFSSDNTYASYPYKATISLTGVTAGMIPEIVFNVADATSGLYAPVAKAVAGAVHIWAQNIPDAAITIPTIICWHGTNTNALGTTNSGVGTSKSYATITLAGSNGSNMSGQTVTVSNADNDEVVDSFAYTGTATTVQVPVGMRYRITVSYAQGYITPDPVECMAVTNLPYNITITYKYGTRYGFKREKANSNPDTRITYLFDAVDKTPAAMNLSTNVMAYGGWEEFCETVARPVMLKTDGTVDYELDHDDQTYRITGGLSDVANTAYDGNAMVEFGSDFKWVKRYQDDTYEYVIFCNTQFDNDYHAYAHTDSDGNIKDAFYWGMFKGSYVGSKMRSIGTGAVMVSTTRQQEIDRAVANGDGYYTIYKSGWDYIGDLLTLISKSDHSQNKFGAGRSLSSNSAAIENGTLKDKPAFWGSSNCTSDVKVFWIEGFWGNVWEGMAGFILDGSNGIKTKMVPPYNLTGSGYTATGIVPGGTSGGYVNVNITNDASGYVPQTASGSETTYMCDGLWFNNSQVDYALVGGRWTYAGGCGSRYVNLNNTAAYTSTSIGSRLSHVAPPQDAA